jgi:mRNA interferase HigB
MKLIGKGHLTALQQDADARSQIESWVAIVEGAHWKTPHELKAQFTKVSLPGTQQAIFDICGNRYRILVKIDYPNETVLIKKAGTHKEYEKWTLE